MDFYTSIAACYDHIFPPKPIQRDFVLSRLKDQSGELHILDIGSATGGLVELFADKNIDVVGIEPDLGMVSLAQKRLAGKSASVQAGDMLALKEDFPPSSFNAVVCLGNTLVHLENVQQMSTFFEGVKYVLKPGGKLIVQVINYDRIKKLQLEGLSTIDNEFIRFERTYAVIDGCDQIEFKTRLTVKESDEVIDNSVLLYPVVKSEIEALIGLYGFVGAMYYGDFMGRDLAIDSVPLIFECTKS
ncbi:class I SAM-dependent methyltransferase [Puteibacter caeruleilacunae]|nr:class I SAM-dependent methyltransferase [Puteibacter caeruleilacunae]